MALTSRFGMPPIRSTGAKLAIALVACSIVWRIAIQFGLVLYLVPGEVIEHYHLWQLITFIPADVLTAGSGLSLIFGAIILWSIGGALEQSWGTKRILMFAGFTPLIAGVVTMLIAIPVHSLRDLPFGGGTVVTSALWVAYGLSIGRAQTSFWGLPVTGNVLALLGGVFIVITALTAGWQFVVPEVIGLGCAYVYVRVGSPGFLWVKFQSWRLQRQLRSRSNHLKVVGEDRNVGGGSDRYLH